jgi:hypothetical protein
LAVRDSDRWVTPRVVVAGLAGLVVVAAIAAVTYLSAIHVDPAPMLKLAGVLAGGLSGLASLALQLAQRRTVAKVERNTRSGYAAPIVVVPTSASVDVDDQGDEDATGYVEDAWERAYLPPVPPARTQGGPRHREGGLPAR